MPKKMGAHPSAPQAQRDRKRSRSKSAGGFLSPAPEVKRKNYIIDAFREDGT
jgi:hypothetical protein